MAVYTPTITEELIPEKRAMPLVGMREVKQDDFKEFIKKHKEIEIENVQIPLGAPHKIEKIGPESFEQESTTVWSFPDRGDWATHQGNYRGNWSPFIPRNLISRYTKPGDIVLDQMVGSGTTLVECKLLGRNGIGVDVNQDSIMLTRDRLNFNVLGLEKSEQKTYVGEARNLNLIKDNSIDLVATHPPYAFIIPYSNHRVEGDLSSIRSIRDFMKEMRKVANESFRVLKPGKHCAILMGDTRKHQHFIPTAFKTMLAFLDAGFILREDAIKQQWKMKSTRDRWRGKYNFLKIAHEHLFIFRKPVEGEDIGKFKESRKWW